MNRLNRRRFLEAASAGVLGSAFNVPGVIGARPDRQGEVLYNGIHLPAMWPPQVARLTREPMPAHLPDYLPPVIPIDVGRQLFVDDFLIEETNLKRTFHQPVLHPNNPILKPDPSHHWEKTGELPTANPFSDGVWYDPQYGGFRMWYKAGFTPSVTCYAASPDGIEWHKPDLGVQSGTNIVQATDRDSSTVWLDFNDPDPRKRYKLAIVPMESNANAGTKWHLNLYVSADGIHWSDAVAHSGPAGDRNTFFYNPFRKVWVFSLRGYDKEVGRCRRYWENPDFVRGANWTEGQPTFWVGADQLDPPDPEEPNDHCELYNLDAVAYESVLSGCFSVLRGHKRKGNNIVLGYSRDGFYWNRPDRTPFIPRSPHAGDWNYDYVQSAGGCCMVVGDKLYFYVSGRSELYTNPDAHRSTGLAMLRRDGFASMDAAGGEGVLTTRKLRFVGRYLFVNAAAGSGELQAEALDEQGQVIEAFSKSQCIPVTGDKTLMRVRWKGADTLSKLSGKPVRFRFSLRNGSLYAFWVSPGASGASHGYVAAGGPGFKGPIDTVGVGSYHAAL